MKNLVTGLLILISTNAFAEWVQMDGSTNKGVSTYADPSTISIDGTKVKMWSLTDLETSDTFNGKLFKSVKAHEEYDCATGRSRFLWLTYTTGHLGGGEIIWNNSVSSANNWKAVSLGTSSPQASLYTLACVTMEQANTTPSPSVESTQKATVSIEEAKSKCAALGVKPKTEAFGKCVLKLSN